MNLEDVSRREILDFSQFRSRVMDDTFKPLDPSVQDPLSSSKSGLHKIKREPAFDYIGYANALFSPEQAGIVFPGYNAQGDRDYVNAVGLDWSNFNPNTVFNMDTNESQNFDLEGFQLLKLSDF